MKKWKDIVNEKVEIVEEMMKWNENVLVELIRQASSGKNIFNSKITDYNVNKIEVGKPKSIGNIVSASVGFFKMGISFSFDIDFLNGANKLYNVNGKMNISTEYTNKGTKTIKSLTGKLVNLLTNENIHITTEVKE